MAGPVLKSTEERANSWILDYSYYCAWKEFFSTNNIDLRTTRDFIQWIVTQPYMTTTERKLKVQIMLFMCRLSDGNDHTTRYSLESDLTALEESLRNIDMIEGVLGLKHTETLKTLKISVKKQAVLVCCRADDFTAGKQVFQRQWNKASSNEEEKVVDHLKTVLESYDKEQSYIKFNTYERFLKTALECLSVIHNTFSTPFLLQEAEHFEKKSHISKEDGKKNFSLQAMEEWAKTKKLKPQTQKAKQIEEQKLRRIREIKEQQETDKDSSDGDVTEEEDISRPKKRKVIQSTPKKSENENNRNNSNRLDISLRDGDVTEEEDISRPKKRKVIQSTPKKSENENNRNNSNRLDISLRDEDQSEEYERSKKRKITHSTPKKTNNICDDINESLTPQKLRDRLNLSKTASILNGEKRKKVPWQKLETEKFYVAVQIFGWKLACY